MRLRYASRGGKRTRASRETLIWHTHIFTIDQSNRGTAKLILENILVSRGGRRTRASRETLIWHTHAFTIEQSNSDAAKLILVHPCKPSLQVSMLNVPSLAIAGIKGDPGVASNRLPLPTRGVLAFISTTILALENPA